MTEIIHLIEESGAIRRGKFKLSNGELTDYYIDKYAFETDHEVLSAITDRLLSIFDFDDIDVVAGPELGAVPLVTALSLRSGIDAAFIRNREKHRGTQARVEGTIGKGSRVAVIEDVSTTGGTILDAAALVEDVGGLAEQLIVIVDRGEGAVENARQKGYELNYVLQVGEDFELKPSTGQ